MGGTTGALSTGPTTGTTAASPAITDDVEDTPAEVIRGSADLDHAGTALVAVGDVDGDGRADFAYSTRAPWTVHVVAGSTGEIPSAPVRSFRGPAGDVFGVRLAGGGDLNGDGLDDLAIVAGTPGAGGTTVWRVEVLLGASIPLLGNQWRTITAPAAAATFGSGVALVPDVDGDRRDELLVSASPAPGSSAGGSAWLYAGAADGVSSSPAWSFEGPSGIPFGALAASAGDLNGDGLGDFVVTTGGGAGPSGYASISVFLGAPSFAIRPPTVRNGEQSDDGFGAAVAAADFNGDGRTDLAVGAPRFDLGSELVDAGRVYEVRGTAAGISGSTATVRTGVPGQRYATMVAAGGDLNGDGYGDLLVGAPLASADGPLTNGQFFAYFGGSAGLPAAYDFTEAGAAGNDLFGAAAAGPGDVNGDGMDDLVVAAPGQDAPGHPDAGALYLYSGTRLRLPSAGLIVDFPDLEDGTALARRFAPYHVVATVVYRGPIADLDHVEIRMICPDAGRVPSLRWVPGQPLVLSGADGELLELAADSAVGPSGAYKHGQQVSASLRFGWAVDEQLPLDIELWAGDHAGTETTHAAAGAVRVVSRLALLTEFTVTGQDGRVVAPGGWVRANEPLAWSGGPVVYEGTVISPPVSEYYVRVGGGAAAPTRATVDPGSGVVDAVRNAPLASYAGPTGFVEALSATDQVLARADHPVTVDGSPVTFGTPNPPTGSRLTEADTDVTIPVADAGSGVGAATVEWSISHSDPPEFTTWVAADTTGSAPLMATAHVHLEQDAPNFIQFRAADRVGNGPSLSPPVALSVDYGAVNFALTSPSPGGWLRSGDVSVGFEVSNTRGVPLDLASLEYLVAGPSGGVWTNAGLEGQAASTSFTLRLQLPDGGANSISLRAALTEGGTYQSRPFTLQVDSLEPAISVLAPTPGAWLTENSLTSRVFITDATSGVDAGSVRYRVLPPGGTIWSAWREPVVQVSPDGVFASASIAVSDGADNFIEWRVSDRAGNGPAGSGYLRVLVDTRPVTFGAALPQDGARGEAFDRVSISVSDRDGSGVDLSSVEYLVHLPDGTRTQWRSAGLEGIVTEATVVALFDLPLGTSVVEWRAHDAAGTTTQHSPPITLTVVPPRGPDLAPRLVLASPRADGVYLSGVDIKLDATPSFDPEGLPLTFTWWVDGVALSVDGPVAWVTLEPGRHEVTLRVADGTGAAAVTTIDIEVVAPASAPGALASPVDQALVLAAAALALTAFSVRVWADRARRALRR